MDLITTQVSPITKEMIEWERKGKDNYFDESVLFYPATALLRAASKKKTILYMPVQTAFMLESLAINPEASNHEVSVALLSVIQSLQLSAQTKGIHELYFLGTNEKTNTFAKRHGLEELPWKVYRMRIGHENIQETSPESGQLPDSGGE